MITFALALTGLASASPRIVNGTELGPNDFPEVVAVLSGGGICTGSLIHPEWVLTAAHCFGDVLIAENPTGNAQVVFGNNIGSNTRVNAAQVIIHPQYVTLPAVADDLNALGPFPLVDGYDNITHDIALVRLAEPVNQTPMALNTAPMDETWIGRRVGLIGFGITATNAGDSGIKRYAESFITRYREAHPDGNGELATLDPADNQGTCQGDSGGPTIYYSGTEGYVQIGITSYGRLCGADESVDMRVDIYIDWIEENAGIEVIKTALRPPAFYCSHQLNPDSPTSIAIGTVPFELQCLIDSGDPETIDQVTWNWGDGSDPETITGSLEAEHTYTEMGVYNLRVCIEGVRAGNDYEDCLLKASHVNACDVPDAAFDATPVEGLAIDVRNRTSLRAHNCVSNARWDVFQGSDVGGEPLLSLTGWEPEIQLEEYGAGDYTVVLNVGGIAGTGAASATVTVGRGATCSSVGAMPAALGGLALLPLLGLRRRRAGRS